MNWFKTKPKPKEEHPMQEEWDRVREPEPPPIYIQDYLATTTLPISDYTGVPYDPEWCDQFLPLLYRPREMPRPKVDPRLIGKDYQ